MRNVIQWTLWIVGLGLQFLVVSTLMAGAMRDYTAVFVYAVILFFTTIVEMLPIVDQGRITVLSANIYWICEFFRQASMVFVVLSFVTRAVPDEERRSMVRRALAVVAVLFWAMSFYIQHSHNLQLWMTNALRNVSFGAALVNLSLWFFLIASKRRDSTLLMITGGLGLQMTGEAIGQSLRQLSPNTVLVGGLMAVFSHFLCLYIWWQAFRRKSVPSDARETSHARAAQPMVSPHIECITLGLPTAPETLQ
jgi:hypothetical protein